MNKNKFAFTETMVKDYAKNISYNQSIVTCKDGQPDIRRMPFTHESKSIEYYDECLILFIKSFQGEKTT